MKVNLLLRGGSAKRRCGVILQNIRLHFESRLRPDLELPRRRGSAGGAASIKAVLRLHAAARWQGMLALKLVQCLTFTDWEAEHPQQQHVIRGSRAL